MFKRGHIVWAKLITYPWWPAIVLNPKDCGRDKVDKDKYWIFWFGDHKVTQVECRKVLDFQKHFASKYAFKMRKTLKSAIQEVLIVLAARYNIEYSDPSTLFKWAKEAFETRLHLPSHKSNSRKLPDIVTNALQKEAFQRKNTSTSEEDSEDEIVNVLAPVSKGSTCLEDICLICCKSKRSVVMQHPFFVGGVCGYCKRFIAKIMQSPKGQMNDICVICGQGGNLVYCSNCSCLCSYCEICIDYLTPKNTLSEILKDDSWNCYLCLPNPNDSCLINKREVNKSVDPPTIPFENSSICVLGLTDAVSSILLKKGIPVDSLSYTLPSSSNQTYNDFSLKEIENISPDFVYGSFFVSSHNIDGEEEWKSFYSSFYKFLYRVLIARKSKPCVLFMYMCGFDIINPLMKLRVKRFLQVDPTIISFFVEKVYLWSNIPGIKGIKGNKYCMKKRRGSKSIEEDVLHCFLKPLKNFVVKE